MPVVAQRAVKRSAVCRLIVQRPVHSRPGSRTQPPSERQSPLAATPERSHSQEFKGEKKWGLLATNQWHRLAQVLSIYSLFTVARRRFFGLSSPTRPETCFFYFLSSCLRGCCCVSKLRSSAPSSRSRDHHQIHFRAPERSR